MTLVMMVPRPFNSIADYLDAQRHAPEVFCEPKRGQFDTLAAYEIAAEKFRHLGNWATETPGVGGAK